ncbi:uncharacterized protein M437DRAFT_62954 [Aureobasidium melanogenum CBS 110374]|uniref:Uncharacterized protein n=1 Tax=Aureobasidium melanogenum (strain CBS 110374) TaxID=1043003 RepID=A0A074W111_AURM1|nr:uncharacterized protein M437DRAFT_62954 [Aureobasidium melanogenum CBS 110374]KEQ66780.1 hypothetical protein M437DRAFT_62954 [Aureobasidium melanogenum CBS 110374]
MCRIQSDTPVQIGREHLWSDGPTLPSTYQRRCCLIVIEYGWLAVALTRAESTTPSVTFSRRFVVSEHGQLDSGRVVLLLGSAAPDHDHASRHVRLVARDDSSQDMQVAEDQHAVNVALLKHATADRMGIRETREMLRPVSKRAASHPFWGRSDRRFSFSQEPPMLAPNHSRSTGIILIQLKTSVPAVKSTVFLDCVSDLCPLICKSRRGQARPIVTGSRVFLEQKRRCAAFPSC